MMMLANPTTPMSAALKLRATTAVARSWHTSVAPFTVEL